MVSILKGHNSAYFLKYEETWMTFLNKMWTASDRAGISSENTSVLLNLPYFLFFFFFFLIKYLAGKFHPALQSHVGTLLPHVGALHANSKSQGNSHAVCSPSSLWAQLRYSPESNSLLQYFLQIVKGSAGWDPDNNSIAGQEDIINEDSHWPRSHMHLWQHIW